MYMTENASSSPSVRERIIIACELLLEEDWYLFAVQAHERTLTQHLAKHLQKFFPTFSVDCEYNRDKNDTKTTSEWDIFPDIVVHQRGRNDNNLIIIEAKWNATHKKQKDDIEKLQETRTKFSYQYAFFINFIRKQQPFRVNIHDLDDNTPISVSSSTLTNS